MNSALKITFYTAFSITMMAVLGAFNQEHSLLYRALTIIFSISYAFAPLFLAKFESTKHLIEIKQNAIVLSFIFLVFLVSILKSLSYGLISYWFAGVIVSGLFATIFIIRQRPVRVIVSDL